MAEFKLFTLVHDFHICKEALVFLSVVQYLLIYAALWFLK